MYLADKIRVSFGRRTLPLFLAFALVDLLIVYNVLHTSMLALVVFWSLAWVAVILIVTAFLADRDDMAFLFIVVTLTFVANLLLSDYFASRNDVYFTDQTGYIWYAEEFIHRWDEEGFASIFNTHIYDTNIGFYILNGLHYLIYPHKIFIVITNVGLKTLTGLYVYLTARKLYNRNIALVAGCFIFFNPFNTFWASFDLKDTVLGFLISVMLYAISTISRGNLTIRVFYIITTVVLISSLRFYAVYFFGLSIAAYLLLNVNMSKLRKVVIASLMILTVLFLRSKYHIYNVINEIGMVDFIADTIQRSNENLANSDFALSRHATTLTPMAVVMSFVHFILTPSPLSKNPSVIFMTPGTIFWYFLFPYYLIGTYVLIRDSWRENVFLYSYVWFAMTFYSLLPYLGSSRHRMMIMPFVALLAAVGMYSEMKHKKLIVGLGYLCIALGVLVAEVVILA